MGFNTRVQCIKRKSSEQWYINLPSALAQAMEFAPSETVEWLVERKDLLALRRPHAPQAVLKKTLPGSSSTSSNSGTGSGASSSAAPPSARKHSR